MVTEEVEAARTNEEHLFGQLSERTIDLEKLQESYVDMTDRCNDMQDEIEELREQLEAYKESLADAMTNARTSYAASAPAATVAAPTGPSIESLEVKSTEPVGAPVAEPKSIPSETSTAKSAKQQAKEAKRASAKAVAQAPPQAAPAPIPLPTPRNDEPEQPLQSGLHEEAPAEDIPDELDSSGGYGDDFDDYGDDDFED